ncbi:HNH endonuclease [Priestia megaterium]|uniref:HNH endonuclease n=1 Tax=Priestia megaterium TaxID=1404 RepID=UPI001F139A94|nr:restriction endonuclease [Priestia megaterium]UMZ35944.1 restriction endonuclease [Priestia megaterium]
MQKGKVLHLLLKFKNEKLASGSDTITEHKRIAEEEGRLIWGHSSSKETKLMSDKSRELYRNQFSKGLDTYCFFLTNIKGEQELYVGKLSEIYFRGEIISTSPLKKFIPSYYAGDVGMGFPADKNNTLVDVSNFFKVDSKYVSSIKVESSGKDFTSDVGRSSLFYVNIDGDLEKLLIELLSNPEAKFQYEVEQEDVPDDVTVEDKPKDKPSKTSGSSTGSYKRDLKTSKTAIVTAKYKCEIDATHEDFISRVTGENYVEAHHLIPMEYQDDFDNSIDVKANIVSLCVGCHKKVHHATYSVIEPLIEKLYDDRIDRLKDCDIGLTKHKFLNYYK